MNYISEHTANLKALVLTSLGASGGIVGAVTVWQEQLEYSIRITAGLCGICASLFAIYVGVRNIRNRTDGKPKRKKTNQ